MSTEKLVSVAACLPIFHQLEKVAPIRLWLLATCISVVMTEIIVCSMGMLLKGKVTYDYLLTGFVASLVVAGIVSAILTIFLARLRLEIRRNQVINENLAATLEALHTSEAHLYEAQRIAHIGNWHLDRTSNKLTWSDEVFRIFKLPLSRFAGNYGAFLDRVHPLDRELVNRTYLNSVATRIPCQIEHRVSMPDGSIKWVNECCETSYDDDGKALFSAGTVQDITERKQAESALEISEERFRLAITTSHSALWDYDLTTGRVYLSEGWSPFLGGELRPTYTTIQELAELVPEEEQPMLKAAIMEAVKGKTSSAYKITHRVRKLDGDYIWVLSEGRVTERDQTGWALRMIGINRDITDLKSAEEKLEFSALVYQAVGEAVMVTDSRNNIIAVNPEFTSVTGYSVEEAIGKNPRFISSGRQDRAFYKAMWQKLNATGIWEGEIWNRHKNGHDIALWQLIHTSYDEKGDVLRRVVLLSDVTDQKRAEETIRRHAYYDPLTGLPNRRLFHDRLGLEIKKSRRSGLPMALMLVDLDHFKQINDTLGHSQGDALLTEAVHRIVECVREIDTVSRLGGDEFTVIISEVDSTSSVDRIAQNIISKLSAPFLLGSETVRISASIGITLYSGDDTEIEEIIKNADQAMYTAKHAGRNCFRYFDV